MNAVSWNYRGVGSYHTRRHIRELMNSREIGAICLIETKPKSCRHLLHIAKRKEFDSYFMVDSLSFAGGLLLLWIKDRINLAIMSYNSQVIQCEVVSMGNTSIRLSFAYVRPNMRAKELFFGGVQILHAIL